jgi:hypothetical protein
MTDEKNWLDQFWYYYIQQQSNITQACDGFNNLFFPCGQNKIQSVYDGIAGNEYWDFLGITQELNSAKGLVCLDSFL